MKNVINRAFMAKKKKEYIDPIVCVELFNTQEMMKASGSSPDTPIDPGTPAPQREYIYL